MPFKNKARHKRIPNNFHQLIWTHSKKIIPLFPPVIRNKALAAAVTPSCKRNSTPRAEVFWSVLAQRPGSCEWITSISASWNEKRQECSCWCGFICTCSLFQFTILQLFDESSNVQGSDKKDCLQLTTYNTTIDICLLFMLQPLTSNFKTILYSINYKGIISIRFGEPNIISKHMSVELMLQNPSFNACIVSHWARPYVLGNSQQPGGNIPVLEMLWKSSTKCHGRWTSPNLSQGRHDHARRVSRAQCWRSEDGDHTDLPLQKKKRALGDPKVLGWIFFTIIRDSKTRDSKTQNNIEIKRKTFTPPEKFAKVSVAKHNEEEALCSSSHPCNLEWGRGWNFPALSLHCHSQALRAKYRFQDVVALPTSPPATVH